MPPRVCGSLSLPDLLLLRRRRRILRKVLGPEMKFNWICIGIRLNRLCKHFVSFHLRAFRFLGSLTVNSAMWMCESFPSLPHLFFFLFLPLLHGNLWPCLDFDLVPHLPSLPSPRLSLILRHLICLLVVSGCFSSAFPSLFLGLAEKLHWKASRVDFGAHLICIILICLSLFVPVCACLCLHAAFLFPATFNFAHLYL